MYPTEIGEGGRTYPSEKLRVSRIENLGCPKFIPGPLAAAKFQVVGGCVDIKKNHKPYNPCYFFIVYVIILIIHQAVHVCLSFNYIFLATLEHII